MIYNSGGFRGTWFPGSITKRSLYDMLPFENILIKFNISGISLKVLLNEVQKGKGGYYPTDGIVLFV
jgi:2',3'-cyclic-nucleotide 2'-phosphodiesterase (5'-nucleotidase family)